MVTAISTQSKYLQTNHKRKSEKRGKVRKNKKIFFLIFGASKPNPLKSLYILLLFCSFFSVLGVYFLTNIHYKISMRTIENLRKELNQTRDLLREKFGNESLETVRKDSQYVPICERENENPLDNFYKSN